MRTCMLLRCTCCISDEGETQVEAWIYSSGLLLLWVQETVCPWKWSIGKMGQALEKYTKQKASFTKQQKSWKERQLQSNGSRYGAAPRLEIEKAHAS